jgi:hypothetical protein
MRKISIMDAAVAQQIDIFAIAACERDLMTVFDQLTCEIYGDVDIAVSGSAVVGKM